MPALCELRARKKLQRAFRGHGRFGKQRQVFWFATRTAYFHLLKEQRGSDDGSGQAVLRRSEGGKRRAGNPGGLVLHVIEDSAVVADAFDVAQHARAEAADARATDNF